MGREREVENVFELVSRWEIREGSFEGVDKGIWNFGVIFRENQVSVSEQFTDASPPNPPPLLPYLPIAPPELSW